MNSAHEKDRIREAREAAHRPDDGTAFLPDPAPGKHNPLTKTDGESFAEEFIASALSGEPVDMEAQDEVIEEEFGGPFVELDTEPDLDNIPEPPPLDKLPRR